jgi:selenocysteine lyase/cysteine desulfurase
MDGLRALKGVTLWTDPDPARSAAIVIFQPGTLDVRRLTTALTKDRIIVTARSGQEWPGLRIAPHFYNTMDDIDRTVGAIRKYLASGV